MFSKWTAVLLVFVVLALVATAEAGMLDLAVLVFSAPAGAGMLDIASNNHHDRYGGYRQYRQPYGYGQPSILDECSAALADIPSKGERIAKAGVDGLSVGFLTKGLTKSGRWAAVAGGSTALVESIIMLKRDGNRRKELQAACLQLMREQVAREQQTEPEPDRREADRERETEREYREAEPESEMISVRFRNRFVKKEVTVVILGGNAPSPVTLSPGESIIISVPQGSGVEAHYVMTIGHDKNGTSIDVPTVLKPGFGIYWVNDQYEIRNPYTEGGKNDDKN